MQLSDDIFQISHLTLSPELKVTLQLLASIHFEDQLSCSDILNSLMYSAAAQLQDIQTVNWNQVRTITSSDADISTLLFIIEEGMPLCLIKDASFHLSLETIIISGNTYNYSINGMVNYLQWYGYLLLRIILIGDVFWMA